MNKWFWIYQKVLEKYESKGISPLVDRDIDYIKVILESMYTPLIPGGDGKFSRIFNWSANITEALEIVKKSFTGKDDILLAFFMGLTSAFECFETELNLIKRG